jgi:putative addiction module CopG family antidote
MTIEITPMNIILNPQQEQFIASQLQTGQYQSVQQVIDEALELLAERKLQVKQLDKNEIKIEDEGQNASLSKARAELDVQFQLAQQQVVQQMNIDRLGALENEDEILKKAVVLMRDE